MAAVQLIKSLHLNHFNVSRYFPQIGYKLVSLYFFMGTIDFYLFFVKLIIGVLDKILKHYKYYVPTSPPPI